VNTDVSCTGTGHSHATTVTIGLLADNVLLEIFDFCQENYDVSMQMMILPEAVWDWHILVHVCRRWRQVVFASPLRLNLQIRCSHGTPVRKNLDIWPTFPIIIEYTAPHWQIIRNLDEDNIIAALEHPDRVRAIRLSLTGPQLGRIATALAIQEQFPVLTHLILLCGDQDSPVIPGGFLGRSVACLQKIEFDGIPFPALPALLLSTSDLVTLDLRNIPQTGYISPKAMVAGLAMLTRLKSLRIEFRSPKACPAQICLPPTTRTVLPALTNFTFWGVREYLEDFVARIDTPQLYSIFICHLNQLVDFEVPQFWHFVDRSDLNQLMACFVEFQLNHVCFGAGPTTYIPTSFDDVPRRIDVNILCEGIDWQASHLSQALNQKSVILSSMVHLAIGYDSITEPADIDEIEWLDFLYPFSSVQTMVVSSQCAGHISRALEDIAGLMAAEILPALDLLCLEGQPLSSVDNFIAVRLDSGHPVTVVDTRSKFDERVKSYQ
jgi:hypothetical protein